ncbi:hypothetical protein Y032_0008g366 [Ancylostoma ceylanicum]|nr:hypothetical protein Y032_0008g366 [Ancylostoma ceylanicum]
MGCVFHSFLCVFAFIPECLSDNASKSSILANSENHRTQLDCCITYSTVSVNGGDPSAASQGTRRDRTAHARIVAAVAYLGSLDSSSSYLMITNKKTN